MSSITDPLAIPDRAAKRNVAVLVSAQAVLGSQLPMIFIVGGLAGQQLAPNPCLATLPISMIVFGSMTTAPWLSYVMQRFGRVIGFLIGAAGGFFGAILAAIGLILGSFWLFLAGSYLTGIYMSSQGFFRFAATDMASADYRPKAISYVMAGGLLSALIGPQIVALLSGGPIATADRFLPVYIAIGALNLLGLVIFPFLRVPRTQEALRDGGRGRTRRALLADPAIRVAVICAMVAYALMNLVMTSTPLAVVGCGFGVADASRVVSAHVLAMFAPSFFTGHLIARFGTQRIIAAGLVCLAIAGGVALQGVQLANFYGALILLGLGWNFAFIGATTMLAEHHLPEERGRVQGMNDAVVFGCVTVASLASGGLMNCIGGDPVQGWTAVNLAMVPFLGLAGGALIWLASRSRSLL
ncbi:MAG: MFS transporter [Pseudomonadota bacterium]